MPRFTKNRTPGRLLLAGVGLLLSVPSGLRAQTAVSSITTTLSTESGGTYQTGTITSTGGGATASFATTSNDLVVSTFKDSNNNTYTYTAGSSANASAAIIRRNTAPAGSGTDTDANENGMSVWYAYTGASSTSLAGAYNTNANNVLLGNNLYVGSDNLFVNNNAQSSTPNQSDIERIDFLLGNTSTVGTNTVSAGILGGTSLAFAVFDRGVVNAHDSFNIALITGYDTNGNPIYTDAALSGLKADKITSTNYGTANVDTSFNYTLFRYDNNQGNNLNDNWNADSETSNQGIGGVVLTLADFGITTAQIQAGLTIYGYSVMAADDTTTLANLGGSNYTNSTDYPTNTTDSGADPGGLDLVAVNGIGFAESSPAPEPSTYGAILAGMGVLAVVVRRLRHTALTVLTNY